MRQLLLVSLVACVSPSDAPPPSIQVQGNVQGVFESWTVLGDRTSTLMSMSMGPVVDGCPNYPLDTATVDAAGMPLAMTAQAAGDYQANVEGTPSQIVYDAAHGDDTMHVTATSAAPFDVTYTAGGPGDPIHVMWTVDPSPADVTVGIQIGNWGSGAVADTGSIDVPGSAISASGDYDLTVIKKEGASSWWCTPYDQSGGETKACCGFWSTLVQRDVTITVP